MQGATRVTNCETKALSLAVGSTAWECRHWEKGGGMEEKAQSDPLDLFCARHMSLDFKKNNKYIHKYIHKLSCQIFWHGTLELFSYLRWLFVGREGTVGPWEALATHSSEVTRAVRGLTRCWNASAEATQVPTQPPWATTATRGLTCALPALSTTGTCHTAEEALLPTAPWDLSNWAPLLSLNICEYHFGNWILGFLFYREPLHLLF